MSADLEPQTRKVALLAGYVLSALCTTQMLFSIAMKLLLPHGVPEHFVALGWRPSDVSRLALLELGCTLVYLVPRTSILGAILLTAYLGGATATHARIGDGVFAYPVCLGVAFWLGLWLRNARLRAIIVAAR